MKKMLVIVTIIVGLNFTGQPQAESNGLNGMLLGAGSGALVGQAIGHNTKGTLVGAAVGTVLGYAIGNEMDYGARPRYYQSAVYEQPRVVMVRPESRETCRETEMLATIDGRPEKVYGTACWQDGEWVRIAEDRSRPVLPLPVVYETVIIRGDHHRHDRHRENFSRHGHHPPRARF